jgi:hypothetical protein
MRALIGSVTCLMPLLELLHLALLVAQLGLFVLKLFLGDLPERVDFILNAARDATKQDSYRRQRRGSTRLLEDHSRLESRATYWRSRRLSG